MLQYPLCIRIVNIDKDSWSCMNNMKNSFSDSLVWFVGWG